MDRRTYLAAATGVLAAGSAGCLRLSTDGTGTPTATRRASGSETAPADTPTQADTPTESEPDEGTNLDISLSGSVPEWADWIPADVVGDAQVTSRDYAHARSTWPESALKQPNADLENRYGTVERATEVTGEDQRLSVYRGTFDTDAILGAFDTTPEETASYRGFDVIDGNRLLAVRATTLVVARPRASLDARYGGRASLGTTDDSWETLLSAVADSPWLTASTGSPDPLDQDNLSAYVRANATGRSYELGTEKSGRYLLFDSAEDAQAVEENDAAELGLELVPESGDLDTLDRVENVLVIRFSRT